MLALSQSLSHAVTSTDNHEVLSEPWSKAELRVCTNSLVLHLFQNSKVGLVKNVTAE